MGDCIFCNIISGKIPSTKVMETERVFAFRDIEPQAPQHVLVLPKRHIAKAADLNASDGPIIAELMIAAVTIAKDLGMDEQGYRLVVNNGETAGQSVLHLHIHLLSGRSFQWPPG